MTTFARRYASTPVRTATATWQAITDAAAPDAGAARDELSAASGTIALLIADEVTSDRPLVFSGNGPQIRIYTVHGDKAIDAVDVNESPLPVIPTDGDWTLTVPVPDDDADWVTETLANLRHIEIDTEATRASTRASASPDRVTVPVIDLSALRDT